ncbi:MAG: hypothetical protein ACHRHE_21900, partial [Tepidisphaerales bacterium]
SDTPNKGAGMYSAQAPHGNDAATATDIGKGVDAGMNAYKASQKEDSPGFLSSLFGGNDTWLGRKINGTSDTSSSTDNGPSDFGGYASDYTGPKAAFHKGGLVRRYHEGDMVSGPSGADDVPAILQTGERVLSREQNATWEAMIGLTSSKGRTSNQAYGNGPIIADVLAHGLPKGYSISANDFYNPSGHAADSAHHYGNAGDIQLYGPDGKPIANEGPDTTGAYGQLNAGAQAYLAQRYPDLVKYWRWGGDPKNGFETTAGSGLADLMHYDVRGAPTSLIAGLQPMPAGTTVASAASRGTAGNQGTPTTIFGSLPGHAAPGTRVSEIGIQGNLPGRGGPGSRVGETGSTASTTYDGYGTVGDYAPMFPGAPIGGRLSDGTLVNAHELQAAKYAADRLANAKNSPQPGIFGQIGNFFGFHTGGMVRKYHEGDGVDALASDEVPAILQTGERVLNRQETAAHDAIFPQGILAAASPGGVGRGAIGEYPLGRNDAINAGAGPIGEALLGMGAGAGVGLMRGALASGVMSDITGAMTNPLMRGAQPTLKLTEDLGDGLMRYGIHMGGEDPVATALIQHPPGGVGQAYIHNIRMTSSITGEANALGPRNLMGVMKQFRNDNPGVTGFGGARVSGARAGGIYGAGGGDVNLSFPSFPSFHRGGMVTRYGLPVFDQGGSVDVLDQMLGDDNKRSTGDWSVGPNLGGGATISGVGPQVGKVTTDRTMDMISMVVSKIGGLKDLFGGGDTGSSSGSDPTIQGDYGGYASDYAGPTLMHRGGLVVPRFHSGGLAGSELPSILTRLSGPAAAQLSPAAATGRSQPGNTVINQNIYTPDANSFRSTLDQTAAAALRAHDRAARNT